MLTLSMITREFAAIVANRYPPHLFIYGGAARSPDEVYTPLHEMKQACMDVKFFLTKLDLSLDDFSTEILDEAADGFIKHLAERYARVTYDLTLPSPHDILEAHRVQYQGLSMRGLWQDFSEHVDEIEPGKWVTTPAGKHLRFDVLYSVI